MNIGLSPVYDKHTEIMILGSAPSKLSLQKQQYYGNPGNQFWKTLFQALGTLDPQNYDQRIRYLLAHRIGLWDVYHEFERKGSMDHHFQSATLNDFEGLLQKAPIKTIIANGQKAFSEIEKNQLFPQLTVIPCLSTSGANNARIQKRQEEWRAALASSRQAVFSGQDAWLQAAAFYLRYQVFVLEQKIPAPWEFDAIDNSASYMVLFQEGTPLATLRSQVESQDCIQLDRFCVLKEARHKKIGTYLVQRFEQQAREQGFKQVLLSSELSAKDFYQKLAYQVTSEPYLEDGILCVRMTKNLQQTDILS